MKRDDFIPSERDCVWQLGVLVALRPGGTWTVPAAGLFFCKTGDKELTLRSALPYEDKDDRERQYMDLHRIRLVVEAIGGKVIIPDGVIAPLEA
jgi:hypothetical protein